ncbi:hypothetical protein SS37A_30630 [Methylocystis iwaonis]|uniref:Transposase IS701-like DDE domain-containing protein n=1 Tax=Methylocystis iwaonis TaxID=2885079 RepID=A0ABN6VIL7_9HYPH|nr:hypothetical protein SS37A_30630 [Methylocystis iwaonis]
MTRPKSLADDGMVLIDETGFLRLGKAALRLVRQYTGSAGKIMNRQIASSPALSRRAAKLH